MKKTIRYLLLSLLPLLPGFSQAQNIYAVDDIVSITYGQGFSYNVKDNDSIPTGVGLPVYLTGGDSLCFFMEPNGQLFFSGSKECCGTHLLSYYYDDCASVVCSANIVITVACKPDCYFVDLNNLPGPNGGQGCAYACENSEAIYYVNYNPAFTYSWSVTGGTFVQGSNPAEIRVSWGPKGNGTILLTEINSNNESVVKPVCVNILEGPVAAFEAPDSVCLKEPVTFNNTTTGGDGFFWDFGDGQTSTMFAPTHEYAAPGTYTVCLIATRQNYDTNIPNDNFKNTPGASQSLKAPGDLLCCCTDTICMEVVVQPLQAPNIYCISTLCANDSSEYWTDAANCSTYHWSVLDENGAPLAFSGQGTDRISVHWGAGPVGTVSLYVEGCDDLYCEDTVSATVPIMSATTLINGPDVVCENTNATYTVQKWISAYYDWQVVNGSILSGQGTNSVTVLWNGGGSGTISVNYYSDFLGGLPGHDPSDCMGTASLNVEIKPRFEIFGPPLECLENTTGFFASPPTNYTWSINPTAAFSGQGTSNILVTWSSPGTYVVTAESIDPTLYCNETAVRAIEVIEVPQPLGIDGPVDICPGETYTYLGQTSEAGVGFDWTVTGGTAATLNGYSIAVTWDATGPYGLSLTQTLLTNPFCTSDPVQLTLTPKLLNTPVTISGPAACINSLQNYSASPAQHPDAKYTWSVSPAFLGSIASGQGTPNVQVQWNNDVGSADLILTIELCGVTATITHTIGVVAPVVPAIAQTGPFCTGMTAVLDAGAGFNAYSWSTGAATQTTTISADGIYSVTTTDANGCTASDSYEAVSGPIAKILSQSSIKYLCLTGPASLTLTAQDGPGYTFEWFCNGVSSGTSLSLTHVNTGVAASFTYWVVVTEPNGCTATSNTVEVIQTDCSGGGPGGTCAPEPFTLSFTTFNHTPDCNVVDFAASASANVTLLGWDFDDPNSNLNTGTLTNAIHEYTTSGLHNVVLIASVPDQSSPGSCLIGVTQPVNVPLIADFKSSYVCETVTFTDMSSIAPTTWSWSFGDGNTSNLQNPVHTYPGPGVYNVTLTVNDAAGCQETIEKPVVAGGAPVPVVTAVPSPYCVDKPIGFAGAGAGIVSWFWNFDDMAENASPSPIHTYVLDGSYNVTLTVTDADGCQNTAAFPLTVNALPPDDVITAAPGLTVCDGTTVALTAPAGTGYTYLWSTTETSQTINVTAGGEYSVTVTGPDGCTMTPDAVTVVMLPLPSTIISGSHYICNSDCIELRAPLGTAYTYQWFDGTGNPIPGQTAPSLFVCSFNLASPYKVEITDGNTLCTAVSAPFDVSVVSSPAFAILISPDDCAGVPITLKVDPVQTDVVYAWSNGAIGVSTVVTQAGTYFAVGRDTITGCVGTASAIIYPLPDLCLVPVGCYEVCDPDTICGPGGLASYQWNLNGMPIPGETNQCLIVTENGDYSLTGVTSNGCSLTSDTLRLETTNCTCFGLSASLEPVTTPDGCCWSASYVNPFDDKFKLVIRSDDTDFAFDVSTLSPSLSATSVLIDAITLENSVAGTPLPMGAFDDFMALCLTNQQNASPQIIFDWYDDASNLVCSDTVGLATDYTVSISCPANIAVSAPAGSTTAIVNYPLPTAASDCPCTGIAIDLTAGLASGSAFSVGATQVCYQATDECGTTATCCFNVEVSGSAGGICDVKTIGCMKYELLGITQNSSSEKTYRIRVTNSCANKMLYTAFQLPNGVVAVAPADNSVYSAPSGRKYQVRNPNASPFYSIRFKSTTDSIAGGQSDDFYYTLPTQSSPDYIHVGTRLDGQLFYEAHLNTFYCPVTTLPKPLAGGEFVLRVFPNPTSGLLNADLSAWKGQDVRLRIFGASGQRVLDMTLTADAAPQAVPLPEGLTNGLYALDVLTAGGERAVVRFVLER